MLKHGVYNSNAHFKIDPITRAVKVDGTTRVGLVQYDHNSERFSFELPRVIEGHDMMECTCVQVHYINIDSLSKKQNKGVCEITDLQISPENQDVAICSWVIPYGATQYEGNLHFMLRFICVDENDDISYTWNTSVNTITSVAEGIYNSENPMIEQWKADLKEMGYRVEEIDKKIDNINANTDKSLNNKLDKVTSTGSQRLYGIDSDGKQVIKTLSFGAVAGCIPMYGGNCLSTGDPKEPQHAVNKAYVDAVIARLALFEKALSHSVTFDENISDAPITDIAPYGISAYINGDSKNIFHYGKTTNGVITFRWSTNCTEDDPQPYAEYKKMYMKDTNGNRYYHDRSYVLVEDITLTEIVYDDGSADEGGGGTSGYKLYISGATASMLGDDALQNGAYIGINFDEVMVQALYEADFEPSNETPQDPMYEGDFVMFYDIPADVESITFMGEGNVPNVYMNGERVGDGDCTIVPTGDIWAVIE